MKDITVLILAAGKGTRMKTNVPKCLTLFHYKPMLSYILNTLNKMKITDIGLIVGYKKEEIKKHVKKKVTYIYQKEQLPSKPSRTAEFTMGKSMRRESKSAATDSVKVSTLTSRHTCPLNLRPTAMWKTNLK